MSFTIVRAIMAYVFRGCKPLYLGWTLPFDVTRAVIRCSMSVYGDRLLVPSNTQFVRTQSEWVGTALGFLSSWQMGTTTEAFHHNGLEHMWVRSAKRSITPNTRRFVVLYYHGGGFAVLNPRMYIHFANEMQTRITKMLHEQLGTMETMHLLKSRFYLQVTASCQSTSTLCHRKTRTRCTNTCFMSRRSRPTRSSWPVTVRVDRSPC